MEADHTKFEDPEYAHIETDVRSEAVEKALERLERRREWWENNDPSDVPSGLGYLTEHAQEPEESIIDEAREKSDFAVNGTPLKEYLAENF